MEMIKRKILLEDYIDRKEGNWGNLTISAFTMNVFFTQDADDMGISTDLPFIYKVVTQPTYQPLLNKLNSSGFTFPFMAGATTTVNDNGESPDIRYPGKGADAYYINGMYVTGLTEDRLDNVRTYDATLPYKPLFDIAKGLYTNYEGTQFQGSTRVIEDNGSNPIVYMINGQTNDNIDIDNPKPINGIVYKTYSGITRIITTNESDTVINGGYKTGPGYSNYIIPLTELYYRSEGFNGTNTVFSAKTREEYLMGITESPTVYSDLFVDRGITTIIQSHMQLSEITNMSELINYGNGYYKIQK